MKKSKFFASCGHNICNCRDAVFGLMRSYQLTAREAVWVHIESLGRTVESAPLAMRDEVTQRILAELNKRLVSAKANHESNLT